MIEGSCHCGLICLEIETAPTTVTDCNCSICRCYGTLWAYYSPGSVRIRSKGEETHTYMCNDHMLAFHRCPNCGCVTHWAATDPALDRMGVNARLLPAEIVETATIRRFDGASTFSYRD